jgi:holliday junction DNA helicase RuvA
MYEYISGKLIELNPAYAIIDNNGIAFYISISLQTYSQLQEGESCKLLIYQVIREDANLLFGFFSVRERDIFKNLISVSGIGANTARMMLSSLSPEEIQQAILSANVNVLKSVKGIGLKSAQRVIIDLKDKIGKIDESPQIFVEESNTIRNEALSALVTLGFPKNAAEKAIDKILKDNPDLNIETLVKLALKSI